MDVYAEVNLNNKDLNPLAQFSDISVIVNQITPFLTSIASVIFLGMLVYGAYNVITAGGEADKIAKAQKIITWAIIGIVVVVFAYGITSLVFYVLNAQGDFQFGN